MYLQDTADDYAIGKHVEVVIAPLAAWAGGRCAEDQLVLIHVPLSFRWHFRHVKLGVLQHREPDLPADGCHVGLLEHQLANLLPMRT